MLNYYKKICINVYNYLSNYGIKWYDKKEFINNIFNLHINSLYNWINDDKQNANKYSNDKINIAIEQSVVNIFNNDKSIINIKKNLNVLCILKTNNLKTHKKIIKDSIDKFIIDFKTDSYTYAVGMIKLIINLICLVLLHIFIRLLIKIIIHIIKFKLILINISKKTKRTTW